MQERKQNKAKRKNPFIRIAVLLIPVMVLLLLSQTVFAQNTYVITDGGRVVVYTSSATDPAEVLTEAGLTLGADDTYTTQTGIGISEITVRRSHTVTVDNCGELVELTAHDDTVASVLNKLGVSVDSGVTVSVPLEMETYNGMLITVSRTIQQVQTYSVSIPYETTYYNDSTLAVGTEIVVTKGQDGQMRCTATVVYVDGQETDRTVTDQTVVRQPVNEVIAVGTAPDVGTSGPAAYPASELIIEDGYIYLPTGEVLSYGSTAEVVASAYSHFDAGCDMITATGTTVHMGTVAVDYSWIPFGTRMFIVTNDGQYVYGISTAEDCGKSIKGDRVDLYFPTQALCFQFGMRKATIYFLN